MKRKNLKNIFYMLNGSIGDFLMALFLMENFNQNDSSINLHVITPRNKGIFLELGAGKTHPYIHLVEANMKGVKGVLGTLSLLRHVFQKNYFLTPSTPGVNPLGIKLIGKFLTLRRGSILIGFDDGAPVNGKLYDILLPFDQKVLYHDSLKQCITNLGFLVIKENPTFSCIGENGVLEGYGLVKGEYIVVHPFGATNGRSYLGEDLVGLLEIILGRFTGTIVITGSAGDKEKADEAKRMTGGKRIKNICGISLGDTCVVLGGARYYIGVDTGTTHLAGLLRKKSLVLAKDGTPYWLPYYNKHATILYQAKDCTHGINEGKEHLFNCTGGERRLGDIPVNLVKEQIPVLFSR